MQCCKPSLTQSKRLFSRGETSMDRHNHKIKNNNNKIIIKTSHNPSPPKKRIKCGRIFRTVCSCQFLVWKNADNKIRKAPPTPQKKKMYYFQPAITSADWKVVLPQFHQKGLTKPSIWSIPSQCPARFENKAAMQNQSRRGNTHTRAQKRNKVVRGDQ